MTDPITPILDTIQSPADMKTLSDAQLRKLADEVRAETISAVSVTGGHLGAGLGVVELTVALHAVFDAPNDKIIWDVSHQCYPHKILTGRRDRIRTLRMKDGLSGFTKRSESPYDPFGAAHSSTSISAALGFAVARDLGGDGGDAIAVRETPAILGEVNAGALLRDILDELADTGGSDRVQTKVEAILSRVACHGSIRTGRRRRGEEMNALVREMEATPRSGQCNHGRPTYVELKMTDIERLFGRT